MTLAIKVSRGEADPAGWQRLEEAARAAGVVLINQVLERPDVYALMSCADCYVSLHRSEGFGLTMAEAMLLGKPVIATGYSGNLDFMTPDNSRLVDYRRVRITQELPYYGKGCFWAEPDLNHAASAACAGPTIIRTSPWPSAPVPGRTRASYCPSLPWASGWLCVFGN